MQPPVQKNLEPRIGPQYQAQIPKIVQKPFVPIKRTAESDDFPNKK